MIIINKLLLAVILFIVTYILMLAIPKYKSYIALTTSIIFIALKILPAHKVISEIDFNILLMIIGTMGTVSLFIDSKMPSKIADIIINKMPNIKWMIVSLSVFAGLISAFIDNVATVLMIAPVTLVVAEKLKISPIPMIISVAIFSNIEGAATLVGDTTSILLAGEAKMNFADFFFYNGKVGLFFIVQSSMLVAAIILLIMFRKSDKKITKIPKTKVESYYSSFLLLGTIITLIIASFIPNKPELINGIICMTYFIIGLIINVVKSKNIKSVIKYLKKIDYHTILLLTSLFLIIGGIKEVGVISKISNILINIGETNQILIYTLIFASSIILSAFIDNIPFVAAILPVISALTMSSSLNPTLLYYGLILGSTLGGNFTPIGASANIAALGILKNNNYEVKLKTYLKYSVPITLAASITGFIAAYLILG